MKGAPSRKVHLRDALCSILWAERGHRCIGRPLKGSFLLLLIESNESSIRERLIQHLYILPMYVPVLYVYFDRTLTLRFSLRYPRGMF